MITETINNNTETKIDLGGLSWEWDNGGYGIDLKGCEAFLEGYAASFDVYAGCDTIIVGATRLNPSEAHYSKYYVILENFQLYDADDNEVEGSKADEVYNLIVNEIKLIA